MSCALTACAPAIQTAVQIAPLELVSLESQGLDRRYWDATLEEIRRGNLPIDGLAVSVGGRFVAESYFGGYSANTPHDLRSATKSLTSLLVGIAVDQGLLSLNDPIVRFFPEYSPHPSWREPITVQHLLTMSSGLNCDDNANTPGNEEHMYASGDWLKFSFAIPRLRPPGEVHSYCTAGVVLLGEIVARASGVRLPAFASQYLFAPLKIFEARWAVAPGVVTDAGGHLSLTPQSMMKIGELVRNGGLWNGKRVISQRWVSDSLEPRNSPDPTNPTLKYGRLWWLEPVQNGTVRSYQARGNGGQFIMVVPEVNLTVAFTGNAYNSPKSLAAFVLMQRFLIPMAHRDPFQNR